MSIKSLDAREDSAYLKFRKYQKNIHSFIRNSFNSTRPTPTETLGMRLSCNFVNEYTIVYHVQYTYVYTRASPTDILARKSARRTKVRGQVSELNRPLARGRPTAARAGHADFRARILARKSARKSVSVSVSVSVPWNLS